MKSIKKLSFVLVSLGFMTATGVSYAADTHPAIPSTTTAGIKLVASKQVQELQAKGSIIADTRKLSM